MKVIIQVFPEIARELNKKVQHTTSSEKLLETVDALGYVMKPLHPETEDTQLMTYFFIEVPDVSTAERMMSRLRQSEAVAAAYVKSADKMPKGI